MKQYVEKALTLLRAENKMLANHPNASIYKYDFYISIWYSWSFEIYCFYSVIPLYI